VKEDGKSARLDERLSFKVIEFSKGSKKIIVSHSRIHEDLKRAASDSERKTSSDAVHKATKKMKTNMEKTTLGDITDLAAIKTEMEKKESKRKKTEKAEKKAAATDENQAENE
jgi:small subunit ribosomal protein S1